MNLSLNKGTMRIALIVIITLLVINIVASAIPAVATLKSKLGLS